MNLSLISSSTRFLTGRAVQLCKVQIRSAIDRVFSVEECTEWIEYTRAIMVGKLLFRE